MNFNANCTWRGDSASRIWLNVGELMSQSGSRKFVRFRTSNNSARNWNCCRFCHLEILKRREVPVGISRAEIYVAAFGAELPGVGCGIKPLESAGVEPRAHRSAARYWGCR